MFPRGVIDSLKCSSCNNILSVFPIHTYGSRDTPVCGRCPVQNDFAPQRQDLFEELAQHIDFPCRYQDNGCIEKLKPSEMKNHEERCPHKPCLCPILPLGSCPWQGEYTELFDHYEDVHPELSLKDFLIDLEITQSFENNYVFCQANETFVAQLKFDVKEAKFYCNVRYCGPALAVEKFSYRVCFLSKKRKYACDVRSVELGEIGSLITANATVVSVVDIVTNLNYAVCSSLKIDIFIKKVPQVEVKANPLTDNAILKMLECPVCLDYMVPPILQCTVGHSFCRQCRDQIVECPTCKSPITETRNYQLEQVTTVVEYPCKYDKFGCTFTAGADQIQNHISNCRNGPYKCVLNNCPWTDKITKLKAHINDVHKDNILETKAVTYILDTDIDSYEYIIYKYNIMFQVTFTRSGADFMWELQEVGESQASANKYRLILDFISQTNERLYVQSKCHPYNLTFAMQQLESFIDDDILLYNMQVIENV